MYVYAHLCGQSMMSMDGHCWIAGFSTFADVEHVEGPIMVVKPLICPGCPGVMAAVIISCADCADLV